VIAVVRSELYRTLTVRSSWVSMTLAAALGLGFGTISPDFWGLFAGMGAYGVAVMTTAQQYQHRTATLLFLGQPRRLRALAAQCVATALIALALAAVSGFTVLSSGLGQAFQATLLVVPLIALFGVAVATVVRRLNWILLGSIAWLILAEGLIGKLDAPLPFSSFLNASTGDRHQLLIFTEWTAGALIAAAWSIRRDLTGD
jgi:hypothetical protein